MRSMTRRAEHTTDAEVERAWRAWLERLLRLDEEIGALAADWPLERGAHPDLLTAVDIARDGLTFMLPVGDSETRERMRRMRNTQLGVKGTGDHRGMQMVTATSVLDVVLELRKVPEPSPCVRDGSSSSRST
jgi:hypothetical protein